MTEFLIFLAMFGTFLFLFVRFLRRPSTDQRVKAQVARELEELRAKVAAEDMAKAKGFGRSEDVAVRRFVPGPGHHSLDQYDGNPPEMPFGRDLNNPDSRTIPLPFQGDWLWDKAETDEPRHRVTIASDQLTYHHALGMEPVVAVYLGSANDIAVVTQQVEQGKWSYAEYYFGLLDGGAKLTNLESHKSWKRI